MRILAVNHHGTLVGGVETYLASVLPALQKAGHETAFVCEEKPCDLFPNVVEKENIAAWKPDVVYLHAAYDLDFQRSLIQQFSTVAFAHGYYGLCISGSKTWARPTPRPCQKDFDWKCLGHFHHKRCGGTNPLTMWNDYHRQRRQLQLLRRCAAVIVHEGPMRDEYLRHGILSDRLLSIPHLVERPVATPRQPPENEISLVFVGRFDRLKGGRVLLESLHRVAFSLNRPVYLHMIGEGSEKQRWESLASKIRNNHVNVEMHGWLQREEKDAIVARSHLLVIPSVWPEPFGQVGLEAASLGVPAAAFDVGGIRNWLREGVNGHLARVDIPHPTGLAVTLANTIVKSLGNSEHYARLRAGALEVAGQFSLERHIAALTNIFEAVKKPSA